MADYDLRFDSSTGTYGTAGGGGTQLMFFARHTAQTPNITGNGTNYQIIYDTADVNVGTCYNTSTGVFTVPQTGIYEFKTGIFLSGVNSTLADFIYYLNNVTNAFPVACWYAYFDCAKNTANNDFICTYSLIPIRPTQTAGDQIYNSVVIYGNGADNVTLNGSGSNYQSWWACYKVT